MHNILLEFSLMFQRFIYIMIVRLYDITSAEKRHLEVTSSTTHADQFVIC
jgi:hypothetical protein